MQLRILHASGSPGKRAPSNEKDFGPGQTSNSASSGFCVYPRVKNHAASHSANLKPEPAAFSFLRPSSPPPHHACIAHASSRGSIFTEGIMVPKEWQKKPCCDTIRLNQGAGPGIGMVLARNARNSAAPRHHSESAAQRNPIVPDRFFPGDISRYFPCWSILSTLGKYQLDPSGR